VAKNRPKKPAPKKAKKAPPPKTKTQKKRRKPRVVRDGSGRIRNYRKEYRRRKHLRAIEALEAAVARDARRVFGRKPKRTKEDPDAPHYELRLAEMAERDGRFDWLEESEFIAQMQSEGATTREAYTLWFSP
jgi:hypothetical protein